MSTRIQIAISDKGIQALRNGSNDSILYDVLVHGSIKVLTKTEKEVLQLINYAYSSNNQFGITTFKQYFNGDSESFFYANISLENSDVLYNSTLLPEFNSLDYKPTIIKFNNRKHLIRLAKANYMKDEIYAIVARDENTKYPRASNNQHISYGELMRRNTAEVDSFHDTHFDDVAFAVMTDNQLNSFIEELSRPIKGNYLYLNGYDTDELTRYQEYDTIDSTTYDFTVKNNLGKSKYYPKSLFVSQWAGLVPSVSWVNIYTMTDKELHRYLAGKFVFCKNKNYQSLNIKYGVAYKIRTAYRNLEVPYDNYVTITIEDEENKRGDASVANPYDANHFWIVDEKDINTFEIEEAKRIVGKYCTIKKESNKHFYKILEVKSYQFTLEDLNKGGERLVYDRKDLIIDDENNVIMEH